MHTACDLPPDPRDEPLTVDPDMAPALSLFLACATQWRRAGIIGRMVGLDYTAVEMVARIEGVTLTAAMLDDIRWLEAGAIDELCAIAERKAADGR